MKFPGTASNGVGLYRPKDWPALRSFLEERVGFDSIIWRGQRKAEWKLESTLDRLIDTIVPFDNDEFAAEHLLAFRYACRGRRGSSPRDLDDDAMWSLGQHYGLATPLLDWSLSPYVALFFAFEKLGESPSGPRAIFGIKEPAIRKKSNSLLKITATKSQGLRFIRPLTDENSRLISQGGLFSRSPLGVDVEAWVRKHFHGATNPVLYRIEIPDGAREVVLQTLNRMNINHLSLFPDVTGASLFCNLRTEIQNY